MHLELLMVNVYHYFLLDLYLLLRMLFATYVALFEGFVTVQLLIEVLEMYIL